jgi:hypothetical protein
VKPSSLRFPATCAAALFLAIPLLRAAVVESSEGGAVGNFGGSTGISANLGLAGATKNNGAAYVFQSLSTATGAVTQNATLVASDGALVDDFGISVSMSGYSALVGASGDDDHGDDSGSAYVFRNLNTVTGTVTQAVKLTASDGAAGDRFGYSVSLSGNNGLVGAVSDNTDRGAAYVFRSLSTATGAITQNAKLTASDGVAYDNFGASVSLSGALGIVGATGEGAVYVYRNLDTVTGAATQNAKLVPSGSVGFAQFGYSTSQELTTALIGANFESSQKGAAYLFRNVDTATGTVNQNVKLTASDGAASDYFGESVALSGGVGLVGAIGDDDKGSYSGAAYLFTGLDTASGAVTEDVKLIASDGASADYFGSSVSVEGDVFLVGASGANGMATDTGKAYSGSVSSVTTLDTGGASRSIDGISFTSRTDWVIGDASDSNSVTLTTGDAGNITAAGKGVYIGRNAGSDFNTLVLAGTLTATGVYVGSPDGNLGNDFRLENTAIFTIGSIYLAPGNELTLAGYYADVPAVLDHLGATDLLGWSGSEWETANSGNYSSYFTTSFVDGYTMLSTVPEPGTWGVAVGAGLLILAGMRRSQKSH